MFRIATDAILIIIIINYLNLSILLRIGGIMKIVFLILLVVATLALTESACQVESWWSTLQAGLPDRCEQYANLLYECDFTSEEVAHYVGLEEADGNCEGNFGLCPIEQLNYAQEHWTEWDGWSETNYCHLYAYLLYVPEPEGCGISDTNEIMDYVQAGCDVNRVKVM